MSFRVLAISALFLLYVHFGKSLWFTWIPWNEASACKVSIIKQQQQQQQQPHKELIRREDRRWDVATRRKAGRRWRERKFPGVCEFLPKICSPFRRYRKTSGWSHWQERSLLLELWAPTLFRAVERGLIESSSAAIGQHISTLSGSHRCKWPGDWRRLLARRWTETASSGLCKSQVDSSWEELYDHRKGDTRRGLCTEHVEALLVQALWRFHRQSSRCLSAVQAAFEQTWGEMGRVFGWAPFYYSPCGRKDEPSRSSHQAVGIGVVGRAGLLGVLLWFASRGSTAYRKWLCRWSRNATHHKLFANSRWRFLSRQVQLGCRKKSTLPGWRDSSSSLHSTRTCSPQAPSREPRLHHCIQAETEPSGTCLSISIGQEWGSQWRNLSTPATRVSDTRVQEQELVSFNPYLYRKDHGKRSAWTLLWACQEQHDTMTLCLPLWTKWQSMFMWFQQHQPLMQKVLLVFTSTMFSRCMAWVSPLFQIEIPASRLPSFRKCLQPLVSSSGWAQRTTPKLMDRQSA